MCSTTVRREGDQVRSRRDVLGLGAGAALAVAGFGTTGAPPGPAWATLRRHLVGDLVLPSDPVYPRARQLASGQYDAVRPAAVAYCASTQDVQTVIRFAGDAALHTVPRSGGHSFGGYSTTQGIVLDVSRLNRVAPRGRTVVAGPGAQQVDALDRLAPYGLLLAGGVCPNVCLGGFTQGGGIGLFTRAYGLALDRLRAATVVLADGRVVRASRDEHPDLFWALRGNGGGNVGVVTDYEIEPVHTETMTNYTLTWPLDAAPAVVDAWQRWAVGAPRALGASLGVLQADVSQPPWVSVYGAWHAAPDGLDRLLDQLVADVGATPATRSVQTQTPYRAMMQWYGCADLSVEQCHRIGYSPEAALPRSNYFATRNRMFTDPLSTSTLHRVLDSFARDGRPGQFRLLFFEAVGGQPNTVARDATAYVHRDARLVAGYTIALTDAGYTPADRVAADRWLADGFAVLDRASTGESYQNFIDPALPDWSSAYYAENYPRLLDVKRRYDPHRFFHFAQGVGR